MEFVEIIFNGLQVLALAIAIILAYLIGRKQNEINNAIHKTQDVVELFAISQDMERGTDKKENEGKEELIKVPVIFIQNVGTRLIYLEKYIFNGREYTTDDQVLPPTYSQALNNFYWIELPTNSESHVSLEVFYKDLEGRRWSSKIFADIVKRFWQIKTLPRKENLEDT
jgi:hypothetical protein